MDENQNVESSIYVTSMQLRMTIEGLSRDIAGLTSELSNLTAHEAKAAEEIEKIRKSSFRQTMWATLAGASIGAIITIGIQLLSKWLL